MGNVDERDIENIAFLVGSAKKYIATGPRLIGNIGNINSNNILDIYKIKNCNNICGIFYKGLFVSLVIIVLW